MTVKPKKMHEIVHAAALIDRVGRFGRCARVLDVGSGLGYLSRTLAHEYSWPVVAVEGDAKNVAEAARIDSKMGLNASSAGGARGVGSLRHVASRLHPTTTPSELWRVVAGSDGAAADAASAEGTSVLVGLHTCGDLAPTSLRVFHHAGGAFGALVSVGCCYSKLSEQGCCCEGEGADADGDADTDGDGAADADDAGAVDVSGGVVGRRRALYGFPMSQLLTSKKVVAGYRVRELACHSLLAYAERLRAAAKEADGGQSTMGHHARRAALEVLLARRGGCEAARASRGLAGMGGAKHGAPIASFEQYVDAGLKRCGLPPIPEAEWSEVLGTVAPMLCAWNRVVVAYVLRLVTPRTRDHERARGPPALALLPKPLLRPDILA